MESGDQSSSQFKKTPKPSKDSKKKYTYDSSETALSLSGGAVKAKQSQKPLKKAKQSSLPPKKTPQSNLPKKTTQAGKKGAVKAMQGNTLKSTNKEKTGLSETQTLAQQNSIGFTNKKPVKNDKKVNLSHAFMMLTSEGSLAKDQNTVTTPHWPGYQSGVTIGFGFDVGASYPQKGEKHKLEAKNFMIQAGIDKGTAGSIAQYVGIRGAAAEAPAINLKKQGVKITIAQASALLDLTYAKMNNYMHHFTNIDSDDVHPALEQVFTYFAYARFNFSWAKKVYKSVEGKDKNTQVSLGANVLKQLYLAELKKPKEKDRIQQLKKKGLSAAQIKKQIQLEKSQHKLYDELAKRQLDMGWAFLDGVSEYIDQGQEVDFSKKVMSIPELLESDTFDLMDDMGEHIKALKGKGSYTRAKLTGQPYTPTPQVNRPKRKTPTITHTPLPRAKSGFSVGLPGGIHSAEIINFPEDVRRIQQKLLEVGLLSKADYTKEYPKEKKIPPKKPDYSFIQKLKPQEYQGIKNQQKTLFERQKEQEEAELQARRDKLLAWLQQLSDIDVRAMVEDSTLNPPFYELLSQSGIGQYSSKGEIIAQLMALRGQTVTPIAPKGVPSIESPTPTELPYIHYLTDFEQAAMDAYGKVPDGKNIPVSSLSRTIAAITIFQREVKGGTIDGRIDPTGSTLKQLMASSKESVAAARKAYLERKKQEEENKKKEKVNEIIQEIGEEISEGIQELMKSLDKSLLVTLFKILLGVKHKNPKNKNLNIGNAVLADLMKKSELNPKEIALAHKLIDREKNIKKRGDLYAKLQYKVPYISQVDSKAYPGIGGSMCNMSSMAMGLATLGVQNPKSNMQYDDALEKIRVNNSYGPRTSTGQMHIANHFGMSFNGAGVYGYSTSNKKMGGYKKNQFDRVPFIGVTDLKPSVWQNYNWFKKNISPFLEKGLAVTLGIWDKSPADNGHIVHLVGIESKGLRVHDPYGKLEDFSKPYGKGWNKNTKSGKGSQKGRLNLWRYEDLAGKEVYLAYLRILQPKN